MKTAPTEIVDPAAGANSTQSRAHNERLFLSLVRRHGALSKAEIARRSGLSAQSATVIAKRLETDGLLVRGAPRRGQVGQPSVPLSLDPDGAVSLGVKIGRRNAEFMAVDLSGGVRDYERVSYPHPAPPRIIDFCKANLARYERVRRLAGLGVAVPWHIWDWLDTEELGPADADAMRSWGDIDLGAALGEFTDLPVLLCNDATAAARAENALGLGRELRDYATFYVGYFVGGGVVLDHKVRDGRTGNAGAFGTLPSANSEPLLHRASLRQLHGPLAQAGFDPLVCLDPEGDWTGFEPLLDAWFERTGRALARACVSLNSVFDFEAILIEGQFPSFVRSRLVERVRTELMSIDTRGIERPAVREGTVGHLARVKGAAMLPLFEKYFVEN